MEIDPPSEACPTLKHCLDTKGSNSPTHKKVMRGGKASPKPTSDAEEQPSPTIVATKRKKKPLVPTAKSKRKSTSNLPPSPPWFHPNRTPEPPAVTTELDTQFTFNPSDDPFSFETPKQTLCPISKAEPKGGNKPADSSGEAEMSGDRDKAANTFQSLNIEWELDPDTSVTDMLSFIREGKETQIIAATPTAKGGEWHIFRTDGSCPDLDHWSDNPYDFLPSKKLNALIDFWHKPKMPTTLTEDEKCFLGCPKIKKMLIKVVCKAALPNNKRTAWFRVATLSALSQNKADV